MAVVLYNKIDGYLKLIPVLEELGKYSAEADELCTKVVRYVAGFFDWRVRVCDTLRRDEADLERFRMEHEEEYERDIQRNVDDAIRRFREVNPGNNTRNYKTVRLSVETHQYHGRNVNILREAVKERLAELGYTCKYHRPDVPYLAQIEITKR